MQIGELLQARLNAPADVSRIAAQVASGVGFLGAGTILHSRTAITGLTSAATIWVVASIGMLAGAGYPTLSIISTTLVVLTLWALGRIEPRLIGTCEPATCELVFAAGDPRGLLETLALLTEQQVDSRALLVAMRVSGAESPATVALTPRPPAPRTCHPQTPCRP